MDKLRSDMKSSKTDKKNLLIESATELFKTDGIKNTTVSDITGKANVAKGTFYLYFKDKDEIVNTVIIEQAYQMLCTAINHVEEKQGTVADKVVMIADELISAFIDDAKDIEIVHKNLYRGLFSKENGKEGYFSKPVKEFIRKHGIVDVERSEKKLYIIIEMVGGVCYNSILNKTPYMIEEIKEELFSAIRSIVEN